MTHTELEKIAASVLDSPGMEDWRCHSVGLIEIPGNGKTSGDGTAPRIAWFHLTDPDKALHHLSLELKQEDENWIGGELRGLLSASPTGVRGEVAVHGDNRGLVVAVNTGIINKNFFGGNFYQEVQLHVVKADARGPGLVYPLPEEAKPYKGLAPYTARDQALFKGRDTQIKQAVGLILQQQVLIIHGAAGVGKTSLLSAGVVPRLAAMGAMIIQIQDYLIPAQSILNALKANKADIDIALPEESNLSQLVERVIEETDGTLVLACDQFELLFAPSVTPTLRKFFLKELGLALKAQPSNSFKVIISVRDEAQAQLIELEECLEGVLPCRLSLSPLDRDQAASAILEPLEVVKTGFGLPFALVKKRIVPDLAEQNSTGDTKLIHPTHLQIVCSWLYEKSLGGGELRVVDEEVYYRFYKAADGIIANYLRETLPRLEDDRKTASRVLAAMAAPAAKRWLTPNEITIASRGLSGGEVEKVLAQLVAAGVVVRRTNDNTYSFVSPSTAGLILQLAGPDALARSNAEGELQRIWLSWLARSNDSDPWASREQLLFLASSGAALTPEPVKTLLLLRSAAERDEPARPWLDWLAAAEGPTLIAQLEKLELLEGELPESYSVLKKAQALVGIPSAGEQLDAGADDQAIGMSNDPAPRGGHAFGPLTESAVTGRDFATRQTSALALGALGREAAIDRLRSAIENHAESQSARTAELMGTLLDADPKFAEHIGKLTKRERARVWLWRARRRVRRGGARLPRLAAYGAGGGGLGMLLLGIATVYLAGIDLPGTVFSLNFFFGAVACGMLTVGLALADFVKPLLDKREDAAGWRWQHATLAIALGALLFGVANAFISSLQQKQPTSWANILSGLVVGAGLSLSLFGLQHVRNSFWTLELIPRLGVAVIGLIVATLIYPRPIYVIPENILVDCIEFRLCPNFQSLQNWLPQLTNRDWKLFDAALAGLVMSLGMMAGMWVASQSSKTRKT